jgi:DNA-binding Lrp family transcriptional regulator
MKHDPALSEFLCWNATVETAHDRLVLLAISRWRRLWDHVIPSITFIADEIGVSRSTAKRSIAKLQALGYVTVVNRYNAKGQAPNEYGIDVQALAAGVPEERRTTLRRLFGEVQGDPHPGSQGATPPVHSDPRKRKSDKGKSKTKTDDSARIRELAESIYEEYPRKAARHGKYGGVSCIEKAMGRLVLSRGCSVEEAGTTLLLATKKFSASDAGGQGEFTPLSSTWFNQERYKDDPKDWERANKQGKQPTKSQWGDADDQLSGIRVR